MDEETIKESAIRNIFHKHLGENPHISKDKIEHCVTYVSTLLSSEPIDLKLFSKIQVAIDDLIQFFNETVYSEDTIAKNNREYCKKMPRNRSNPVSTRSILQGKLYVRSQMREFRTGLTEALKKVKVEIKDLITAATPATIDLEGSQASATRRDPVSLPYQDELDTPARKKKRRKKSSRREQPNDYFTPPVSTFEDTTASLQALNITEENTSYSSLFNDDPSAKKERAPAVRKKERATKKVAIPYPDERSSQDEEITGRIFQSKDDSLLFEERATKREPLYQAKYPSRYDIPDSFLALKYNSIEKSDLEEASGSAYQRWQPAKSGWEESYYSIFSEYSGSLVQDDRGERDNYFTSISTVEDMAASLQSLNMTEENTSYSMFGERGPSVRKKEPAIKKVAIPYREKHSSQDKEITGSLFQLSDEDSDLEEASGSAYPTWRPS
jgi:hypothetical protein